MGCWWVMIVCMVWAIFTLPVVLFPPIVVVPIVTTVWVTAQLMPDK